MCLLCGEDVARHDVALSERPAQRLHGLVWAGSYEEAASSGAIGRMIGRVRDHSQNRSALWKSPIVGLSWNDAGEGRLRYFAGFAPEDGEAAPEGYETVEVPEMMFASSWHGADDGDVVAHYGRIVEWVNDRNISRDTRHFDQREEYPADVELSGSPTLRLLLPVALPAEAQ